MLLYGGYRVIEGDMTVGVLAAFLLYLRMFFEPMQEISQFYNTFQSASAALEKLSGVLEEVPEVPSRPIPCRSRRRRGEIRLDAVSFAYVPEAPVLAEFDLTVPAGQTVALVGTTGAGKTTIAKLMSRFYDPAPARSGWTGSTCAISPTPTSAAPSSWSRRRTSSSTERSRRTSPSADPAPAAGRSSRRRRAVGADAFIDELPEGYDTDVAKRGGRLSAGQRQLVAFARAFLADPAVLILDEATSSLDVPSERLVQRALRTILADRTAVIIAHRLSTVEIADRVLVLEHGEIVEDGPPEELLGRRGGHYAGLHQAWRDSLA